MANTTEQALKKTEVFQSAYARLIDGKNGTEQFFNIAWHSALQSAEAQPSQETTTFLRERAQLEQEWAVLRQLQEAAKTHPQPSAPVAQTRTVVPIAAEELAALHRFCETSEDGEGYDVPKPMMQRLACIGLVRHCSRGIYEITTFGQSIMEPEFFQQPEQAERHVLTELPERVIDTLWQAAGLTDFHPDGSQLGKFYQFAHNVTAEVLARLPSTATQVAAKEGSSDLYYLQDKRSYVGNCPMWWAKDGKGYTTRLDMAHRYTKEEAFAQHLIRDTDIPWPCSVVDPCERPTIDVQDLHKTEYFKNLKATLAAPSSQKEGEQPK